VLEISPRPQGPPDWREACRYESDPSRHVRLPQPIDHSENPSRKRRVFACRLCVLCNSTSSWRMRDVENR
jgi:hypothetical protein